MLGVGEEDVEVRQTLKDLRSSGVDVVTFGQCVGRAHTSARARSSTIIHQRYQREGDACERERERKRAAALAMFGGRSRLSLGVVVRADHVAP